MKRPICIYIYIFLYIYIYKYIYNYIYTYIYNLLLKTVSRRYTLPRDASATYGDHLGPKTPTNLKQMISTKIVHTSGTFLELVWKNVKNTFETMFPYRVKYNESESDIKNNNLLFKIHQKYQNAFELLEHFENKS